ncbi:hypothetical protein DFJ77DRAFT_26980 [Powellomyces hirtus]|nr:hypothetical protein DFJ77DRAFT_26980 [Powellomyces hirtus]
MVGVIPLWQFLEGTYLDPSYSLILSSEVTGEQFAAIGGGYKDVHGGRSLLTPQQHRSGPPITADGEEAGVGICRDTIIDLSQTVDSDSGMDVAVAVGRHAVIDISQTVDSDSGMEDAVDVCRDLLRSEEDDENHDNEDVDMDANLIYDNELFVRNHHLRHDLDDSGDDEMEEDVLQEGGFIRSPIQPSTIATIRTADVTVIDSSSSDHGGYDNNSSHNSTYTFLPSRFRSPAVWEGGFIRDDEDEDEDDNDNDNINSEENKEQDRQHDHHPGPLTSGLWDRPHVARDEHDSQVRAAKRKNPATDSTTTTARRFSCYKRPRTATDCPLTVCSDPIGMDDEECDARRSCAGRSQRTDFSPRLPSPPTHPDSITLLSDSNEEDDQKRKINSSKAVAQTAHDPTSLPTSTRCARGQLTTAVDSEDDDVRCAFSQPVVSAISNSSRGSSSSSSSSSSSGGGRSSKAATNNHSALASPPGTESPKYPPTMHDPIRGLSDAAVAPPSTRAPLAARSTASGNGESRLDTTLRPTRMRSVEADDFLVDVRETLQTNSARTTMRTAPIIKQQPCRSKSANETTVVLTDSDDNEADDNVEGEARVHSRTIFTTTTTTAQAKTTSKLHHRQNNKTTTTNRGSSLAHSNAAPNVFHTISDDDDNILNTNTPQLWSASQPQQQTHEQIRPPPRRTHAPPTPHVRTTDLLESLLWRMKTVDSSAERSPPPLPQQDSDTEEDERFFSQPTSSSGPAIAAAMIAMPTGPLRIRNPNSPANTASVHILHRSANKTPIQRKHNPVTAVGSDTDEDVPPLPDLSPMPQWTPVAVKAGAAKPPKYPRSSSPLAAMAAGVALLDEDEDDEDAVLLAGLTNVSNRRPGTAAAPQSAALRKANSLPSNGHAAARQHQQYPLPVTAVVTAASNPVVLADLDPASSHPQQLVAKRKRNATGPGPENLQAGVTAPAATTKTAAAGKRGGAGAIDKEEKARAKEALRLEKAREKAEKAEQKLREAESRRAYRAANTIRTKTDCVKEMIVQIPAGFAKESETDLLVATLREMGADASVVITGQPPPQQQQDQNQDRPPLIWKRRVGRQWDGEEWTLCPEHIEHAPYILVRLTGPDICRLLEGQGGGTSLVTFHARLKSAHPGKNVIYLVEGVETYLKRRKGRRVENEEEDEDDADETEEDTPAAPPPAREKKKTTARPSAARRSTTRAAGGGKSITMADVEDQLVALQLHDSMAYDNPQLQNGSSVRVHSAKNFKESVDWISSFTDQISLAPELAHRSEAAWSLSFGDKIRSGDTPKDTYCKMLQQIQMCTLPRAAAVVSAYPTLRTLSDAFAAKSESEGKNLLAKLRVNSGTDANPNVRNLGPQLAKRIWMCVREVDPEVVLMDAA